MSSEDRDRWDAKYAATETAGLRDIALPAVFAPYAELFPAAGLALEVACGRGRAAIWLARRGLVVLGLDISPVAVAQAGELARAAGMGARCRFDVADLDDGLPAGPAVDVVLCHKYRHSGLDRQLLARLKPGGLLAISALSEVGAGPGSFRIPRGELQQAFGALDVIAEGEADGLGWLVGLLPAPDGNG
ncbi:class I SAM-dependent methyltransferase [Mycolicibacterium komossense]|uniref:Class I SAM-dependent methyltransferase n=1 Tax=Mycolicibacterium komossense TaxID=1779 RepID=A0ABT3CAS1_9MYCO|nr:class I SAM-dependent methyltransferase [Mycolicibacterium komossense]MCV7226565.1 class I SAM-dependent methyltransferase [Mycolicibacterium komossense]